MDHKKVVIYARVSSREQEREGFSIPAQLKLLKEYALKNGFQIVHEYSDAETAKKAGRTNYNAMLEYLKKQIQRLKQSLSKRLTDFTVTLRTMLLLKIMTLKSTL